MKARMSVVWLGPALGVFLLTGCDGYYVRDRAGPPPHAPAHGYRHHHQDRELVYDAGHGVYVVVGLRSVYYDEGFYYRHRDNRWYRARRANGPWHAVGPKVLPPGLRGGPPPHSRGKGKAKGRRKHGY